MGIEVHDDLIAVLHECDAGTTDRLRHDRHDERTQVEPDVDAPRRRDVVGRSLEPGADRDAIRVVGQGVGKADDHLVVVGQIIDGDASRHDRDVGLRAAGAEGVARAAAPHDRNVAESRRVDLRARAEPQRNLLRGLRDGLGGLAEHEERVVARRGVRCHEVERHQPPVLERFHPGGSAGVMSSSAMVQFPRAIREQAGNRGQPGVEHVNTQKKRSGNRAMWENVAARQRSCRQRSVCPRPIPQH